MRIEIIHHQRNPFCMLVLIGYFFNESCPVIPLDMVGLQILCIVSRTIP
jgi:hypothetical protein